MGIIATINNPIHTGVNTAEVSQRPSNAILQRFLDFKGNVHPKMRTHSLSIHPHMPIEKSCEVFPSSQNISGLAAFSERTEVDGNLF